MAKNSFHLGLNAAENTHHSQKTLKWKLFSTEFCPNKFPRAYVYLPSEWNWEAQKIYREESMEKVLGYITLSYGPTQICTVFF